MTMIFRYSLICLVAGALASCSVIQQVVEKPSVRVERVKFHPVSLREGRLDSQLHIYNPNGFSVPMRALSYHLELNDHRLVDSRLAFDKSIPAKGTLSVPLPIRFHYQEVLGGIESVLRHHRIRFQLAGKVDLGLVKVPFSKTGEFNLSP